MAEKARFHFTHPRPIHSVTKQKIATTNTAAVEEGSHSQSKAFKYGAACGNSELQLLDGRGSTVNTELKV